MTTGKTLDINKLQTPPEDKFEGKFPDRLNDEQVRDETKALTLLEGGSLSDVNQEADERWDNGNVVTNTEWQLTYATKEMDEIDRSGREWEAYRARVTFEPIRAEFKTLNLGVRNLEDTYDPSKPDIRARLLREARGDEGSVIDRLRKFINDAGNLYESYLIDKKATEDQMDLTKAKLIEGVQIFRENLVNDDRFIEQHQQLFENLVKRIAVMELLIEKAQQELEQLGINPPEGMARHQVEKRQQDLVEFIQRMSIKRRQSKTSMWVAKSISENMRTQRNSHFLMAMRMNDHNTQVMPELRVLLVTIEDQIENVGQVEFLEDIDELANRVFQKAADIDAERTPEMFRAGAKAAVTGETVTKMSDRFTERNNALNEIFEGFMSEDKDIDERTSMANRIKRLQDQRAIDAALSTLLQSEEAKRLESENDSKEQDDSLLTERQRRLRK